MARWRLVCGHYLNTVPPTTWEYKEADRQTGKQVTRRFDVPTWLDPNDPSCWTNRDMNGNGETVVAQEGKTTNSNDIIFTGPPTPDMVPMDDEAMAITKQHSANWSHPIESLSGNYGDALLKDLEKQMDKVALSSNKPASIEGITELMAAMTTIMKQNQELLQALAPKPAPEPAQRRA